MQPIRLLLAHTGTEVEEKRYNIGPAPEYDRSEWMNVKYTLGLDFPNVIELQCCSVGIDNLVLWLLCHFRIPTILMMMSNCLKPLPSWNIWAGNMDWLQRLKLNKSELTWLKQKLLTCVWDGPSFATMLILYITKLLSLFEKN